MWNTRTLVVHNPCTDAVRNTALGAYLLNQFAKQPRTRDLLMLSTSKSGVFIGRNQNCWKECNMQQMQKDRVPLVRRMTGGGACFVDDGNLLFSVMTKNDRTSSSHHSYGWIVQALQQLGFPAELKGRNDVCIGGLKVSGSAFTQSSDGSALFHHGTVLLGVDKTRLRNYLNPDKLKLASKGVPSISARVANLREWNPSITKQQVMQALSDSYLSQTHVEREVRFLDRLPPVDEDYQYCQLLTHLKSSEFLYNSNPDFTHQLATRLSFGSVEVHLDCAQNEIFTCLVFSDCLDTELPQLLQAALVRCDYTVDSVAERLERCTVGLTPSRQSMVAEFRDWFLHAM